jgi:hypothetical protein
MIADLCYRSSTFIAHTRFSEGFGTSMSETTMRPNPTWWPRTRASQHGSAWKKCGQTRLSRGRYSHADGALCICMENHD